VRAENERALDGLSSGAVAMTARDEGLLDALDCECEDREDKKRARDPAGDVRRCDGGGSISAGRR
jgi:hypothetical protein